MTRIGIQISSVRPYLQAPEDVLASLRKVSAAGYRVIQVQWISPAVPAEFIRDALQETHLQCVGTQDYYHVVTERWEAAVAETALWGGKDVCLSGIPERYQSAVGCFEMAEVMNRRSLALEAQGMTLSFHPRRQDVFDFDGRNSLELLFEYTRPEVRFCLDVYHLVKTGLDPLAWIEKVRGRCDLIHFKDFRREAGGGEVLVPTGQGEIDWPPIFRACEAAGIAYGFAEQESWQKDPFECLKESYDYLVSQGVEP